MIFNFSSRQWRLGILLALLSPCLLAGADTDKILDTVEERLGGLRPDSIAPSPVPGLYEIMVGPRVFYVSGDGRYFISGTLKDLVTGQDLTEQRASKARRAAVDAVGEDKMLVFGQGNEKYTVDVFTDIDCGYCRKLHSQIDEYNKQGIRIRYLFYPRAGLRSASAQKAETVWCSKDRHSAMTKAKQGEALASKSCDNPVQEHYYLGQAVGVRGTPAMLLQNGKMIPGYVPPKKLRARLDALSKTAQQ